ncbi:alpha/beta fold hydrolase [Streptomyces netropsis]|uniref:esterase/lipase family protein n=1 Tax=Streptomyces netropsis TaxID=55404 RepID=UPI0030CDF0DC
MSLIRPLRSFLLAATAACAVAGLTAAPAAAAPRPAGAIGLDPQTLAAVAKSLLTPDAAPEGANDWDCKPSAEHPRPVVLVHGTWANALNTWASLSPRLKKAGYCVYTVNFGAPAGSVIKASGPVPESAKEIAAFVDKVLARTGADKVDMVGHSQGGGLLPRWYLKFEGGAQKVNHLVGVAPSNHGTDLSSLLNLGESLKLMGIVGKFAGQAAIDQTRGSDVTRKLDEGGDTVHGVTYTTIVTTNDRVVTPHTNQYLTAGAGATVTNHTVQDHCPSSWVGHAGMTLHPAAAQLVLSALDPNDKGKPECGMSLPF